MNINIKNFVSIAAGNLQPAGPVYEFGSLQVPGQEGFANLRPLFPGLEYVGTDKRSGPGVDQLLDLHQIDLPSESVGTAICIDTLEHVEYPHISLEEIHRVLRPDGIAIISSVMYCPIHEYPSDYWRFTPEAFRSLLKPFAGSFVGSAGKETFPVHVVGVGFKGGRPDITAFEAAYEQWKAHLVSEHPFYDFTRLLVPPVLRPVLSPLYRRSRKLLLEMRQDRPA